MIAATNGRQAVLGSSQLYTQKDLNYWATEELRSKDKILYMGPVSYSMR